MPTDEIIGGLVLAVVLLVIIAIVCRGKKLS